MWEYSSLLHVVQVGLSCGESKICYFSWAFLRGRVDEPRFRLLSNKWSFVGFTHRYCIQVGVNHTWLYLSPQVEANECNIDLTLYLYTFKHSEDLHLLVLSLSCMGYMHVRGYELVR